MCFIFNTALPLKMKTRPIFDFVIFLPLLPQMKNDTFQKAFDLDTYLPALDAVSFFWVPFQTTEQRFGNYISKIELLRKEAV